MAKVMVQLVTVPEVLIIPALSFPTTVGLVPHEEITGGGPEVT